jgi:hypothetical protein
MSEQNPTQKGPQIVKPPAEGQEPPKPTCPACRRDLVGLFMYAFQLGQGPSLPTLVFQSVNCPHEDCRCCLGVYPTGQIEPQITRPRVMPS